MLLAEGQMSDDPKGVIKTVPPDAYLMPMSVRLLHFLVQSIRNALISLVPAARFELATP
jgi:hypothetical protein